MAFISERLDKDLPGQRCGVKRETLIGKVTSGCDVAAEATSSKRCILQDQTLVKFWKRMGASLRECPLSYNHQECAIAIHWIPTVSVQTLAHYLAEGSQLIRIHLELPSSTDSFAPSTA